ncbi:hypothetical protein MTR67_015996 [Solanum verrucosum]|uniref:Uncharacterized protein n=1 Tax=Solanum verrucosum TaxID=315347 RepID=A0AAF0TKC5_SOLVR|nr:hypothetical protein MTR67_015996 [Solanum verrucosum]
MCTAIWPSPLVSELWKEKMDRGGNGWSLSSCTYGYTLAVIVIILTCHLLNSRLPFALSFLSVVFGFRERSAANPHAQSNGHPDVAPSAPSDVRGEDIPTTIIGVDDTSDDRVRALARITSASYLIVGGEITVRNVHVESLFPSAGVDFFGSYQLQRCLLKMKFHPCGDHISAMTPDGPPKANSIKSGHFSSNPVVLFLIFGSNHLPPQQLLSPPFILPSESFFLLVIVPQEFSPDAIQPLDDPSWNRKEGHHIGCSALTHSQPFSIFMSPSFSPWMLLLSIGRSILSPSYS